MDKDGNTDLNSNNSYMDTSKTCFLNKIMNE